MGRTGLAWPLSSRNHFVEFEGLKVCLLGRLLYSSIPHMGSKCLRSVGLAKLLTILDRLGFKMFANGIKNAKNGERGDCIPFLKPFICQLFWQQFLIKGFCVDYTCNYARHPLLIADDFRA